MQPRWGQPSRSVFQRDRKPEERSKEKTHPQKSKGGLHFSIYYQCRVQCYGWQESRIINLRYLHLTFYSALLPFSPHWQSVEKARGEHFTRQKLQSAAKEARVTERARAPGVKTHRAPTGAPNAKPTQRVDRKFWRWGHPPSLLESQNWPASPCLTVPRSLGSNLKILKLDSSHANAFQGDSETFQGISKPLDQSRYPASSAPPASPHTEAQSPARARAGKHPAGTKAGDSQARSWADSEGTSPDEEPRGGQGKATPPPLALKQSPP